MRRIGLFLCVWIALTASAQSGKVLDETVARRNLIASTTPVYPEDAKSAKIFGNVVLQVQIGQDGRVMSARVLSGPALLRGAAIDTVAKWQFRPFVLDGAAAVVKAKITVTFPSGNEEPHAAELALHDGADGKIAVRYSALAEECHKLVAARGETGAQAKACRDAATEAEKFAVDSRFIERRAAFVFCATALMRHQENAAAVTYGEKAVAVVEQGHDDASGSSAAYAVRGQAEAMNGDLPKADRDLSKAEEFERAALKMRTGEEADASYKSALRSLLSFHADVLKAMGKDGDAAARSQEADSLKP